MGTSSLEEGRKTQHFLLSSQEAAMVFFYAFLLMLYNSKFRGSLLNLTMLLF